MAEGQEPFETVHTNEFVPVLSEVTCEEKLLEAVTEPPPLKTDQTPVPILGLIAAKVTELAQTV